MNNINNSNNSITKNAKDNVMFYIAPIPIMHPHIVETFCEEDQGHWGQFIDIDPTVPVVLMNPPTQEKKPRWSPRCDTIKENPTEIHEYTESWYKEYMGQPRQSPSEARPSVCSHFEFLGKIAWSILQFITFIDYPIPITNTEEPPPQ
jgi:hypothetical protein